MSERDGGGWMERERLHCQGKTEREGHLFAGSRWLIPAFRDGEIRNRRRVIGRERQDTMN